MAVTAANGGGQSLMDTIINSNKEGFFFNDYIYYSFLLIQSQNKDISEWLQTFEQNCMHSLENEMLNKLNLWKIIDVLCLKGQKKCFHNNLLS